MRNFAAAARDEDGESVPIVSVGGGTGSAALCYSLGPAGSDRIRVVSEHREGGTCLGGDRTRRQPAAPDWDASWSRRSTIFGDTWRVAGTAPALRIAAKGSRRLGTSVAAFTATQLEDNGSTTLITGNVERLDRARDGGFTTVVVDDSGRRRIIWSRHLHLAPTPGEMRVSNELVAFREAHPDDRRAVAMPEGIESCVTDARMSTKEGIIAVRGDGRTADRVIDWLLRHPSLRRLQVLHICSVAPRAEQPDPWGTKSDSLSCTPERSERPTWRPAWFERCLTEASRNGRYLHVRSVVRSIDDRRGRLRLVLDTQAGPLHLLADRYIEAHRTPHSIASIPALAEFARRLGALRCDDAIDVGEDWSAPLLSSCHHKCYVSGSLAYKPSVGEPDGLAQLVLAGRAIARSVR